MPFSPPHLLEVWPLEKRMGLQNCIVELRGVQDDLQGHNALPRFIKIRQLVKNWARQQT
jgi:hypothetical protein